MLDVNDLTRAQQIVLAQELRETAANLVQIAVSLDRGDIIDPYVVSDKIFDATHGGELMDQLP